LSVGNLFLERGDDLFQEGVGGETEVGEEVRGELVWGDGRFWVKEGSAAARKKGGGEKDEPRRFQVNVSRSLYTSCSRSIRIGMRCSSVAAAARSCAFELFEEEKSVTNGKKRAEEGNVQQYRCPQLPSNPLQLLLNLLLRPPQFEPLLPIPF
jgi:hypothetical protein